MDYFIYPHKEWSFLPSKSKLYLTNNGLFAEHQCSIEGNLLITPDRIERQGRYLVFESLNEFIKWVDEIKVDQIYSEDITSNKHVEVGYLKYEYITEYGKLHLHRGIWMGDLCVWETPKYTTYLDDPNNWL